MRLIRTFACVYLASVAAFALPDIRSVVAAPAPPPATEIVPEGSGSRISSLVCDDLHIEDVAFAVITDHEQNAKAHAALRTWLKLAPFSYVFTTQDGQLGGADHVQALKHLQGMYSGAKWFIVSDEDTVIYLYNLLCFLSTKDHSKPHFIGTHHCQGPNFECQSGGIMQSLQGWANGGAGMVFSAGLMEQMDIDRCVDYYSNHWPHHPPAADVAMSCCVADNFEGGEITHHEGFLREGPRFGQECECRNEYGTWCTFQDTSLRDEIISHHHISENEIHSLFEEHMEAHPQVYSNTDVYCSQADGNDPTICNNQTKVFGLWEAW